MDRPAAVTLGPMLSFPPLTTMKHLLLSLLALSLASLSLADSHASGDDHDHEHAHGEALRAGHMDLLVLYEADEGLHLAIAAGDHDHAHDHGTMDTGHEGDAHDHDHEHIDLDDAEIVGGAAAVQVTPDGAPWAFLGGPGRFVYVLPQSEVEGLPFLGLNAEELDAAAFATDITLTLLAVEGDGSFALYQVDAFGQPLVHIDSNDAMADSVTLPLGTHVHMNWAFSAPGEYELVFAVSGTLTDGTTLVSEPQTVEFHLIGQPTYVHEDHSYVALAYDEDHGLEFSLVIDDDHAHEEEHGEEGHSDAMGSDDHDHEHEHGEGIHPADAIVVLGGYAVASVPDNAALSFLGAPGSLIYLIGQSEAEGVPYLGWDAEDLHAEDFMGDPVIELHDVEGPGALFLYAVDAFGGVTVIWDTTDALEDALVLPIGSHAHYNLAVTAPGTYHLDLHAEATLADGDEVETHTEVTLQAGGLEGYLGHFDRTLPDWVTAETGGTFYTGEWPWLWSDTHGWLYAAGDGGPNHLYYHHADGTWLWTSPAVYPLYWTFGGDDWLTW